MLLIEVSDSSLSADLQEKADLYAEAGVEEYWVVDVPSSRIHVLSKNDGKSYRKIEIAVAPQFLSPTCLLFTPCQTRFVGSFFRNLACWSQLTERLHKPRCNTQ